MTEERSFKERVVALAEKTAAELQKDGRYNVTVSTMINDPAGVATVLISQTLINPSEGGYLRSNETIYTAGAARPKKLELAVGRSFHSGQLMLDTIAPNGKWFSYRIKDGYGRWTTHILNFPQLVFDEP